MAITSPSPISMAFKAAAPAPKKEAAPKCECKPVTGIDTSRAVDSAVGADIDFERGALGKTKDRSVAAALGLAGVGEHDTLLVYEAMKMENNLTADRAGVIAKCLIEDVRR